MYRRKILLLFLLIVLFSANFYNSRSIPESSRIYIFRIYVNKDGSANVTITFIAKGSGDSWLYLPKFEKVYFNYVDGNVEWIERDNKSLIFYSKEIFHYTPGQDNRVVMNISYRFPYASLMVKKDAWFMSPHLEMDENSECIVNVKLNEYTKINQQINLIGNALKDIIPFDSNSSGLYYHAGHPGRIIILYKLKEKVPEIELDDKIDPNTTIKIYTPKFYLNFSRRIIDFYRKMYPKMSEIFGVDLPWIKVEYFLPQDFPKVFGYVPGYDINEALPTTVHVNLALSRYVIGYLEYTATHELVHVMLGKVGVAAMSQTRWFHEGMAEYIAYEITYDMGYRNVSMIRDDHIRIVNYITNNGRELNKLGFIQNWNLLRSDEIGIAYSASFYIINSIASKYGGLDFCRKFAYEAREWSSSHGRIDNMKTLLKVLNKAVGTDLSEQFKSYGFNVETGGRSIFLLGYFIIILVSIVLAIIALTLIKIRKMRRKETPQGMKICKYCGSIIPKESIICPVCLKKLEES